MIAALAALALGAFAPGLAASAAVDTAVSDTVTARDLVVAPAETLRVTSQGRGRPVVLIPGLYGGAFSYRKITPPLAAAGFHVIVIDPLGTGWASYPAKADYSLTAQCDRIAYAMELLGVRSAVVVSSALASSITLRLAYRHPDLVAALVSIDGGPADTASTPGSGVPCDSRRFSSRSWAPARFAASCAGP